jgi:hypothetical protein
VSVMCVPWFVPLLPMVDVNLEGCEEDCIRMAPSNKVRPDQ